MSSIDLRLRGVPSQLTTKSVSLLMEKCPACGFSVIPQVDVHGHRYCTNCRYCMNPEGRPPP